MSKRTPGNQKNLGSTLVNLTFDKTFDFPQDADRFLGSNDQASHDRRALQMLKRQQQLEFKQQSLIKREHKHQLEAEREDELMEKRLKWRRSMSPTSTQWDPITNQELLELRLEQK